jgi:hypothetical protein
MGVFMAVLMVAFIHYVKGIGDAIVFRERMQDAADSAAFAAATVHARGMNLVALINIATVGTLATVAATRLMYSYLAPATALLAALQAPGQKPGIDAAGAAGLARYESLERPLFRILSAGHTAASAIATAIPLAAEERAMGVAAGAFQPAVEGAFAYPRFRARLPVEDSTVDELAVRAGPPSVPLAIAPFRPFPVATGFASARPGEVAASAVAQTRAMIGEEVTPENALIMVPQRLSGSAVLGGERLQLRVVVGGHFDFALSERGVDLASWGQTEEVGQNQKRLMALSRISMAQAEYYHAGSGGRDEWLWSQSWRARLRRVRLDEGPQPCAMPAVYCDAIDQLFQRGLGDAVVH